MTPLEQSLGSMFKLSLARAYRISSEVSSSLTSSILIGVSAQGLNFVLRGHPPARGLARLATYVPQAYLRNVLIRFHSKRLEASYAIPRRNTLASAPSDTRLRISLPTSCPHWIGHLPEAEFPQQRQQSVMASNETGMQICAPEDKRAQKKTCERTHRSTRIPTRLFAIAFTAAQLFRSPDATLRTPLLNRPPVNRSAGWTQIWSSAVTSSE
jgi:hypothetical protein